MVVSDNSEEIFQLYPNPYKQVDEYAKLQDLISKIKQFESSMRILESVTESLPLGIRKFLS